MTKKRFGCLRILLIFCVLMICLIAFWALMNFTGGPRADKPLVRVSPETTAITEPLDANGDPDYVEFLNRRQSVGVTPENNAAVLILQAIGPTIKDHPIDDQYYRRLGIEPLPPDDDYFVGFEKWLDDLASKEEEPLGVTRELLEAQYEFALYNPWTAEQFPELAAWLEKNRKPLELLEQAALRPRCYCPMIDLDKHPSVLGINTDLQDNQRVFAKAFSISAMKNLGEGNIEQAFQHVMTTRRHARLLNQGALGIERLMANAVEGVAIFSELRIAQSGKATKQQLLDYRVKISDLPTLESAADCFRHAERYMVLDFTIKVGRNVNSFAGMENIGATGGRGLIGSSWRASCDWESSLRITNPFFDRIVAAMEKPTYREAQDEVGTLLDDINGMQTKLVNPISVTGIVVGGRKAKGRAMGMLLTSLITSPFGVFVDSSTRVESQHRMSLLVLSLEAYKTVHGEYPQSLDLLVPAYCDVLPLDPYVEEPFHYKRTEQGFKLYSVGINLQDDHGFGFADTDGVGDDWSAAVLFQDWNEIQQEIRDRWEPDDASNDVE